MTQPPAEPHPPSAGKPPSREPGGLRRSGATLVIGVAAALVAAGLAGYSLWPRETGPASGDQPTAQEIAEQYGSAVWRVETSECRSPGVASAFAVGPRTLVTHAHVVANDPAPLVVSRDDETSVRTRVVGLDADLDVALLEANQELPGEVLEWADPEDVSEGDTLVALGYPVPDHAFGATTVDVTDVRSDGTVPLALRLDGFVDKGSSGGPVLNGDGRVAGMVTHLQSGGDRWVPVALTHDYLAGAIDALERDQSGVEVDCELVPPVPTMPADWDWDDPRQDAHGPENYGEAETLDRLFDTCRDGDMEACDVLYWRSSYGSEYEAVASSCGGLQPEPVPGMCAWLADAGAFDNAELPWTFGDDPYLDGLWTACEGGDMVACDDLYFDSPVGSDYEEFGATCGETGSGFGTCALEGEPAQMPGEPMRYGDDPYLDGLWEECSDGDMGSCDALYFSSVPGSEYEEFGTTCGGRSEPVAGRCS